MIKLFRASFLLFCGFALVAASQQLDAHPSSSDAQVPTVEEGKLGLRDSREPGKQLSNAAFENLRFKLRPKIRETEDTDSDQLDLFYSGQGASNMEKEGDSHSKITDNILDHHVGGQPREALYPGVGRPPFETDHPKMKHGRYEEARPPCKGPSRERKAPEDDRRPIPPPHHHHHGHHKSRFHFFHRAHRSFVHSPSLRLLWISMVIVAGACFAAKAGKSLMKKREGRIRLEEEDSKRISIDQVRDEKKVTEDVVTEEV